MDQYEDLLILQLPKKNLTGKFPYLLNLSPTDLQWPVSFFSLSSPSVYGKLFMNQHIHKNPNYNISRNHINKICQTSIFKTTYFYGDNILKIPSYFSGGNFVCHLIWNKQTVRTRCMAYAKTRSNQWQSIKHTTSHTEVPALCTSAIV